MVIVMEILVASEEISGIEIRGGKEKLEIRGGKEDHVLKLRDVLEAINGEIKESIEQECDVKIEITGSVSIGGEGGINWGILNLGGSGEKKDSVTISLTTKLVPTS